ncbi:MULTISPECIES: aKG-HExxH-type peptide beta-hydroxylase [unclassified Streptomyces]|uniref:aKG-HExxH-type peptide beta-hydroxylase n=1 Tax=unclassified Streptomyces TaxID=2593676 RepID=UPI002E2A577A|nr:HEXXH motif-containing putative peptide modification protein [Streptomyces sp. NBC_01429]
MYHLEGSPEILRNAAVLSHPYLEDPDSVSAGALRIAYLCFLRSLAGSGDYADYLDVRIKQRDADADFEMLFTDGSLETNILGSIFGNPDVGGPVEFSPAAAWQLEKCRAGGDFIAEKDARLAGIISLLTHTVFTVETSWKGSMSDRNAIGATLIIPGENWHENDIAEAFIHEFTHTALFMDERAKGHFRAGADEVLLHSAIRKDERTLPAVVHSLLVATEVLSWRKAHGLWEGIPFRLHGSSQAMLEKAGDSYRTLVSLPNWNGIVKERMFRLVDAAGKQLEMF